MKTRLLLLLLFLATMAKAQVITFADPTFKAMLVNGGQQNFTAYYNNVQVTDIDTNNDNEIQVSEALLIDRLFIEGVNAYAVTNIGGVEGFANLKELGFVGVSTPSINLSGMPNLTYLYTSSPVITSVTVSGMPGLENLSTMDCPLLASVSVSNCSNLQSIIAQDNAVLTAVNFTNLQNLQTVYLENNLLSTLNLTSCPNLESFNANSNQLTSINVAGLTSLTTFLFDGNPTLLTLNAAGCSSLNLNGASFSNTPNLQSADFSGCSALQSLAVPNSSLTTLNLSGCSALSQLDVNNNELTNLNISGCSSLLYLDCGNNELTSLDLSSSTGITEFRCYNNSIATLNLTGCNALVTVNLEGNQISALDLSGRTALQSLMLTNNPTASVDLSGCSSLNLLNLADTEVVTADFSGCSALTSININSEVLESVNLNNTSALTSLVLSGTEPQSAPITSLNVSGHTNLQQLICNYASLTSINLDGCTGLTNLSLFRNPIESIDFSDSPDITILDFGYTHFESINVSGLQSLENLTVSGNPWLEMIFAKNSANENIYFNGQNVALAFVCQDEAQIQTTQNLLSMQGLSGVEVNTYCSFTPGGDYNRITGIISFDGDNNGCDSGDVLQPNVRIDLNDGIQESATFTNADGEYTFYTGAGSFNLSLMVENPELFSVSPSTATVPFVNDNNNESVQNFCITSIGTANDAEIVIAPIVPAKPGFSAWYQIVIKNKGNQTLNGSLSFTYNEEVLDFEIATLLPSSTEAGVLGWNYSNLQPFESKSIYVGLNVNSPVEVPAVNIGDILHFTATVNPVTDDITPVDNQFIFNQEVVGSFDPNDITCMEGETLSPEAIGEYLYYVVNFENTGTSEAENIVVRVNIDETEYDISSLQVLNTSHPSRTLIHGNVAEFIFEGINLAVSSDPPVNGHGNVLFKVKTASTLSEGDIVTKKADIYFDYNAPIETNMAETTFALLSNPDFDFDAGITIYPNPAKDFVTINSIATIKTIELFDIQGRIIQVSVEDANIARLDISDRSNGIYFLRVTSQDGVGVYKIIKE